MALYLTLSVLSSKLRMAVAVNLSPISRLHDCTIVLGIKIEVLLPTAPKAQPLVATL